MSSDGSVSSRISQFGLYRTIDARTEEFLKLSKKRQIKQGCVCAAISTALTVTVVVTVLLIYEYNVIAKARTNSYKSNWLGLMNNSADDSNLLEILTKEKIDIDKTTLKLLPILLKALNRNSYMEKIVEEPATRYTPYEKDITTETTITKNIFADTRNWMKTTPSRLYTIEYKTSPIVYFKNPTRNVEYFTKIRKIRDYQRILNYVDKMINEKNYLGTTQPMRSDYGHTEKAFTITTPYLKPKPKLKIVNEQKMPPKTTTQEKQPNCKCSHKLSEVMYKLLNSIQQLLTYFSGSNSKEIFRCNSNTSAQKKPLKSLIEKSTVKNIHKMINENYNDVELTRVPPYKTFLNRHKYTIDTPAKGFNIRRDHTVNAIMNLIKPNFKKYTEVDINLDEPFSSTNSYVKSSDINNILKESLKFDNTNAKTSTVTVSTVADYILQKGTYDISSEIISPISTFSEHDSDEDDYADTTETTNLNINFKPLHLYNTEVVKNSLTSGNQINVSIKGKSYPFKGARASQNVYNNIRLMRKMGNLASKDKDKGKSLFSPSNYRFAPITNQSSKPTPRQIISTSKYKINVTSTIKPTKHTKATTTKTTKETKMAGSITNLKQNLTNNFPSKETTDKVQDESLSKETDLKHIEEAIIILNNETTTNQVENYNNIVADSYQWEMVKSEENSTVKKMMLPLGRSTYLEMQRNDWKHEENHDFDNDLNYILD